MTDKYQPHIIGVSHLPANVTATLKAASKLKVKKVGIEYPRMRKHERDQYSETSGSIFWEAVTHAFRSKGIEVVPLISDQFFQRIMAEELRTPEHVIHMTIGPIINKYEKLVKVDMLRDIETNVQREKPEMILTGVAHALLMRKDFRVPHEKFQLVMEKAHLKKIMPDLLEEVKDVRRWQRKIRVEKEVRKQARKAQPKTRRKGRRRK